MQSRSFVITFIVVAAELRYLDEKDNIIAVETRKTSMDRCLNYCKAHGITPKDLSTFKG